MIVESRERNLFEKLFIVAQKLQAGKFPLAKLGKSYTVGFTSSRGT